MIKADSPESGRYPCPTGHYLGYLGKFLKYSKPVSSVKWS
jgi:hypothetical protein